MVYYHFFNYNNLVFLSSKDEKELMELLQIEDVVLDFMEVILTIMKY